MANIKRLAEEIIEEVSPGRLNEQSCVDYALMKGLKKNDGQEAWRIIFAELKALNSLNSRASRARQWHNSKLGVKENADVKYLTKQYDRAGCRWGGSLDFLLGRQGFELLV